MAFVATWLRLSAMKQLTWYRRSARQGKDIAHAQKTLAQRMTDKVARPANTPSPPSPLRARAGASSVQQQLNIVRIAL